MKSIQFRLIGSLNDFLPAKRRNEVIQVTFQGDQTYKHLIESVGVPHPEIDRILVNSQPADLNHIAQDKDAVEVFPYPPGDSRIRPSSPDFVLDGHLGKLASYLRILGFDVSYRFDSDDASLAALSASENRILLTRDRGLLKRNQVQYGYWIRSQAPRLQLLEILQRYDLAGALHPFTRCPKCNGELQPVEKNKIASRLLPSTRASYEQFWRCSNCQQIYWQGSHYQRIRDWMNGFLPEA